MNDSLHGRARTVSDSRVRTTALMGAAATALIAATPMLHAAEPQFQSATLQAAVRNALRLPVSERMSVESVRKAFDKPAAFTAASRKIDFSNSAPITVGADQTAIPLSSLAESISVVNTGDLTGGIGIDVSTGAVDLDTALINDSQTFVFGGNTVPLYDDAGDRVLDGSGYPAYIATAQLTYNFTTVVLPRDPADSTITIDNSGRIDFAGRHGIRASNPAGQSVGIVNSGDVTATEDTEFRSGIYARTDVYSSTNTISQTATGERTYNSSGQVTGVVSLDEYTIDNETLDMEYDGGSIAIDNSGNIDMGVTTAPAGFDGPSVWASVGIQAIGDGGTTIVNSGDVRVDRWSAGIDVRTTAAASISNSGRIDIGNYSVGISLGTSRGRAGDYRLGGDVYVVNSGEIVGGVTRDEVAPGETPFVNGISVTSLGSNNEYLASYAHINELRAGYNEILGEEVFPLFDYPNVRLYETTVANTGRIELLDGSRGIFLAPDAGHSTAINSGTIIVGDGVSFPLGNVRAESGGILHMGGLGSVTTVNAAGGVIIGGDNSIGIRNNSMGGDSYTINEGSITVGNGEVNRLASYDGTPFDRVFTSIGMWSNSPAPGLGAFAYARNSGDITVGSLATGVFISGQGLRQLDPGDATAVGINEGIITTGDDASGLFTMGTNTVVLNSGTVSIGDIDLSRLLPDPIFGPEYELAQLGYGVASWGEGLAQLVNEGRITTGDGTVGAAARMYDLGFGYGAQLLQTGTGVIVTGDDAVGARVVGNYYAGLGNDGRITVGDDSTGIDMSAGSVVLLRYATEATVVEGTAFASNSGIVETGDDSVGLRIDTVLRDVPYAGIGLEFDPPGCSPYYPPCSYSIVNVEGTADSVGTAYLANSGTIRTGARSTAVEITGRGANELGGVQIFNTGTILAGADGSGTAIRINADNDLDSYVVNVGAIGGSILFGAGDDLLVNTQLVDATGRVTSTGALTLNGSTIDFGAGSNRFELDRGVVTIAGGDNTVSGADTFATQALLDAVNGVADSTLTFDGDVTGSFTFATDLAATGADRVTVTGNVGDGSSMSLVLNPVEQLKGDREFTLLSIAGDNGASAPTIGGVSGQFADSLLRAETRFDAATGDVVVLSRFGMGHMGVATTAATSMAQNWWLQSVESFDKRNMHKLAGHEDAGISVWSSAFHEEGTIHPDNSLQNTSFDQKVSGLQAGIQWTGDAGGGVFSIGPSFSVGQARANPNANLASAEGDVVAFGLNANFKVESGLYADATWQTMTMETDFRTPGTASGARGQSDADGDGFNVEVGYAYKLESGLALVPQLQYGSVDVEFDSFRSSDDTYAFTGVEGTTSLVRAGVGILKTFKTEHGSITPVADLNYLYAADGESGLRSNGVGFDDDTSGDGYRAEFGVAGRYKAWDITGRVGFTEMSTSDYMLSTNLNVRYRW
jgi:outer membrane autotransporter protein